MGMLASGFTPEVTSARPRASRRAPNRSAGWTGPGHFVRTSVLRHRPAGKERSSCLRRALCRSVQCVDRDRFGAPPRRSSANEAEFREVRIEPLDSAPEGAQRHQPPRRTQEPADVMATDGAGERAEYLEQQGLCAERRSHPPVLVPRGPGFHRRRGPDPPQPAEIRIKPRRQDSRQRIPVQDVDGPSGEQRGRVPRLRGRHDHMSDEGQGPYTRLQFAGRPRSRAVEKDQPAASAVTPAVDGLAPRQRNQCVTRSTPQPRHPSFIPVERHHRGVGRTPGRPVEAHAGPWLTHGRDHHDSPSADCPTHPPPARADSASSLLTC